MPFNRRRPFNLPATVALLLVTAAFSTMALADEEIPAYVNKGPNWKTGLVTHESVVWDTEFAAWVAAGEKKAHDEVAGNWKLLVRCTFAHCYSGGFVHELKVATTTNPAISDFSANSACKYFETASAYEDDTVPAADWYSRYAFAWKDRGTAGATENPVWTFKEITKRAYNGMITGGVGDITVNPYIGLEHPQYLSSQAESDDLKTGDLKLAILFAGDPERRHLNNMDQIRTMLKDKYGFVDDNIWIMCGGFGSADAIPNFTWTSKAKATRAELLKALKAVDGFVVKSIKDYATHPPLNDKKVKLFIWTTDHGTADAPILMSASSDSNGDAGTDVSVQANPAKHMYDAGNFNNTKVWTDPAGEEIDSFSTGNDELYLNQPPQGTPSGRPGLYFSVDRNSWGLEETDVDRTIQQYREPAAGVFAVAAGDDNREFIRGETVGLLDQFFDDKANKLPTDDLTALSTVPSALVFNTGVPIQPVFWTKRDLAAASTLIWVKDPFHPLIPGKVYVYWDPIADGWPGGDVPPKRLDGLSIFVNMANNKRWPAMPGMPGYDPAHAGDLKFKAGVDAMIFSVPKGDPFRNSGCDVYRWNGMMMETIYTCESLGLDDEDEVDALQAYVNGPYRSAQTPSSTYCPPDFNEDGVVDGADLGYLLGQWLLPGWSDLDHDGTTAGSDLGLFLSAWGPCPLP